MSNTVTSNALEVHSVSKKAVLTNYGVVFAVKNIKFINKYQLGGSRMCQKKAVLTNYGVISAVKNIKNTFEVELCG